MRLKVVRLDISKKYHKPVWRFGLHSYLFKAIKNNAKWCDLITKGHGKPGDFESGLWRNTNQVPLFYPNIITLDQKTSEAQKDIIDTITSINPKDNWAIKDSYARLELEGDGFFELFESHWFYRSSEIDLPNISAENFQIVKIETDSDLLRWEKAWSKYQPITPVEGSIFPKSILSKPDVVVLASIRGDEFISGLIANKTDDVIGISNLFGLSLFEREKMLPLLGIIWQSLGRNSFVGYESIEDIERAVELDFEAIGALKVWMKS